MYANAKVHFCFHARAPLFAIYLQMCSMTPKILQVTFQNRLINTNTDVDLHLDANHPI